MIRSVRWAAAILLLAGYALGTAGKVGATATAQTVNAANTFAAMALYSPVAPSAAPLGHTATVSWTASSPQNGNGYVVSGTNVGSSPSAVCPTAASAYAFAGGTAATSFTDATSIAGGADGTYVCYLVRSGFDASMPATWGADPGWASADSLPTVKTAIGFFADSLSFSNGGVANTLDAGDTITLTFDQPVDPSTVPPMTGVCAKNSNSTIYLGQTLGVATCSTSFSVGTLTGMTLSSTLSLDGLYNATAAWTNANKTYTVTIGALVAGSVPSTLASGIETYTPAAAIRSLSGAVAICSTGACTPMTTGRP